MRSTTYYLLALLLVLAAGQAQAVAQTAGGSQQAASPRYSYVHHSFSEGSPSEDSPSKGSSSTEGSSSEGLPSDHVSEVVRDSLGFAWVGTAQGLIRYDGHRMMPVKNAGSRPVTALHQRTGGGIWFANEAGIFAAVPSGDSAHVRRLSQSGAISGETNGAAVGEMSGAAFGGTKASLVGGILTVPADLQPNDLQLEGLQPSVLQPDGPQVNGPQPNGLYEDTGGNLWMSRADGSVLRARGGKLRAYTLQAGHLGQMGHSRQACGSKEKQILFAEDRRGRLWALAPGGQLYRFDRSRDQFESVRRLQGLSDPRDFRIRGDTLWAVGDGLGRAQVTEGGTLGEWQRYRVGGRTLTHMAFGPEGLLLGTQAEGLFRAVVEPVDLILRRAYGANDSHRITELPFQNICHLYVDRDGAIWVSSKQGLGVLKVPFFRVPAGLPNYTTFAVHPEESGALLSLGEAFHVSAGSTGGLPSAREVPVTTDRSVTGAASTTGVDYNGAANGLASANSASSAEATLWLGTSDGRLLTVESGKATRVRDLSDRGEALFYLYDDRRGSVWLCQAPGNRPLKGVTRMGPGGELTFYGASDGLGNRVLSLREGPEGMLYTAGIGPGTYLHRYVPGKDRFVNLSRPLSFDPEPAFEAHDLAIGPQGAIWLATTAGLLRRGEKRTRRVDLGLAETEIRAVEAMPNGDLWLGTPSQGLLHYRDGKTVQFGVSRGLTSAQVMYRTLRADGQGRLWAGTTVEGVAHSRDRVPVPDSTPAPVLLSAKSSGQPLEIRGRMTVTAREGLSLRYAPLTFPAGRSVQYQYRVLGTGDSTWSDPFTGPQLQLSQVPAGTRAIEVRARDGSGHYWSRALRVPLRAQPVWYQRWWAYALFGLLGAGVAGGLARLYTERRRAQKALRDQETRLRGIANSIPGVVFQFSFRPDGTHVSSFVSGHTETLLGISADPEGFYERFASRIPEPRRKAFRESVEEAIKAGAAWRHEMPFETPSGRRLWLLGASIPEERGGETIYNGVILDITERKERERLLKEEQEALQSMYRITADREAGFEAKVRRLIDLGREHLGLPYGFLTRLSEEKQEVVIASGTHPLLQAGESCPLSQSYCRKTIQEESSLVVQDAGEESWAGDPAYETFGLGAYIGAKVIIEGELYGTLCFADDEARDKPFSGRERTFVELMAQWVSYELERRHARVQLERQNERLDSFASFLTHDLRNPLNVAVGRLQLAQNVLSGPDGEEGSRESGKHSGERHPSRGQTSDLQTGEDKSSREQASEEQVSEGLGHLAALGRALTRMNDLIEDVMTLTWSDQTLSVEEQAPCHLDEVATICWNHVDTAQATLRVGDGLDAGDGSDTGDGLALRAHEDRLQRLLENLFRNAIEHAGSEATVHVGKLPGGFFVEDDGPGIPPEEREAVLKEGYSSNEEGTGLGLPIVTSIAEAHGWSISVMESEAGGARFEVTGAETAAPEATGPETEGPEGGRHRDKRCRDGRH